MKLDLLLSIGIGLSLANWQSSGFMICLQIVIFSCLAYIAILFSGAIFCGLFRIPLKEDTVDEQAKDPLPEHRVRRWRRKRRSNKNKTRTYHHYKSKIYDDEDDDYDTHNNNHEDDPPVFIFNS